MTHPQTLTDYVLSELSPQETRAIELHLEGCAACRAELRALRETLVTMTETLPPVALPGTAWEGIQARLTAEKPNPALPSRRSRPVSRISKPPLRRRVWQPLAWAASLVMALSGLLWGFQERQSNQQLVVEQRKVAGWLSRPDVSAQQLTDAAGERLGSVLILSDGRALFVLRAAPPAGTSYQAWGYGAEPSGTAPVNLGLTGRTLLEVLYTDYQTLELSLEPKWGSLQPTQPLGRVAVPNGSS